MRLSNSLHLKLLYSFVLKFASVMKLLEQNVSTQQNITDPVRTLGWDIILVLTLDHV